MKKVTKKLLIALLNTRIYLLHNVINLITSKDRFFYFSALVVCFVELGLFGRLQLFGVRPNLMLLLLTFYCFYFGFDFVKVLLFSFTCGALKDVICGNPLGTYIFIFIVLGVCISFAARKISRFNWPFILLFFTLAVIGEGLVYNLLQRLVFNNVFSLFTLFVRILLLELIYTLILFFVFFKLIKKCVIDKLV